MIRINTQQAYKINGIKNAGRSKSNAAGSMSNCFLTPAEAVADIRKHNAGDECAMISKQQWEAMSNTSTPLRYLFHDFSMSGK